MPKRLITLVVIFFLLGLSNVASSIINLTGVRPYWPSAIMGTAAGLAFWFCAYSIWARPSSDAKLCSVMVLVMVSILQLVTVVSRFWIPKLKGGIFTDFEAASYVTQAVFCFITMIPVPFVICRILDTEKSRLWFNRDSSSGSKNSSW